MWLRREMPVKWGFLRRAPPAANWSSAVCRVLRTKKCAHRGRPWAKRPWAGLMRQRVKQSARLAQSLSERSDPFARDRRRQAAEKSDRRYRRLLRARRERPRHCRTAEQRNKLAALHSRTSLARATNTSDKETPSDAAVFRLTAM